MIIEQKELTKAYQNLIRLHEAEIASPHLTVHVSDANNRLSLAAPVYQGDQYIPPSVRQCVKNTPPFTSFLTRTYLTINENDYQISLHYQAHEDHLNDTKFGHIIDEFSELAEAWKRYLDDNEKKDLIHVRVK
jgi:hypothetical protein